MPSFVHPALLWGLALIGVPVLIHLINLWRHRRVQWAAMEFLLESRRKNRRWVMLKELLLLLLRMLALAALVLVVAQPLLNNRWGALLGTSRAHHIVLLDDSYSMSDHWADTTAFARAKQAVGRIAASAQAQQAGQTFTLLRFSRAAPPDRGPEADLFQQLIDTDLEERLEVMLRKMQPSQTAATPATALEAMARVLGEPAGENRVLYLVTDFRAPQWQDADDAATALEAWNRWGAQIHLVQCVDAEHANLGIASLEAEPGTLAAGVPFAMNVTVTNRTRDAARDVVLTIEEDGKSRPAGVTIEEIPPGQSESRRFAVNFATAGQHTVSVSLASDSVEADNRRFATLDVPLAVPVLLVDGEADAPDALFVSAALAPGGSTRTGVDPVVEGPAFLADQPLDRFQAIYLLNVESLESKAIARLEEFVRSGGGLAIFVGEKTRSQFINESLYRGGQGLFPLPLGAPAQLFVDREEKSADLEVTDHPVFRIFSGERNSFLQTVTVDRYFTTRANLSSVADRVRVLAKLRNGAPLALEQNFGRGRVVTFLTTAGPRWNNWARNPSYVVALLELQAHLARAIHADSRTVGTPLAIEIDPARYQPRVRFAAPGAAADAASFHDAVARDGALVATLADTDRAGVYTARLTTTDGHEETRLWAFNVDPEEGRLALTSGTDLAASLGELPFELHAATDLGWQARDLAGLNLSQTLLYLLAALLVAEMFLALSASYHLRGQGGRR